MHELSVTEALLEIALRHAQAAQARQITGLHVVIGQLSSVIDDSVQFYWDFVSAGTLAALCGKSGTRRATSRIRECITGTRPTRRMR